MALLTTSITNQYDNEDYQRVKRIFELQDELLQHIEDLRTELQSCIVSNPKWPEDSLILLKNHTINVRITMAEGMRNYLINARNTGAWKNDPNLDMNIEVISDFINIEVHLTNKAEIMQALDDVGMLIL